MFFPNGIFRTSSSPANKNLELMQVLTGRSLYGWIAVQTQVVTGAQKRFYNAVNKPCWQAAFALYLVQIVVCL